MPGSDARQQLLDRAIDHVAAHGLGDRSLRGLAASLGTSHRMLSHHFGSKDGMWLAIVQEVERRQRSALADLAPEPGRSAADALRTWWQHLSDPALGPNERLFFELYGRALQGEAATAGFLDDVVSAWVEPTAAMAVALGMGAGEAQAFARLGLAVTRGLLLDLLATEDRAGVDAAMDHWIALVAPRFDGPAAD